MNRVFKTKWSVAHQEYVVTDEKHATKTKAAKSAVALAVSAVMLAVAGTASAAFVQPSHTYDNVNWRNDAEFMKDWGAKAMNADKAYTLGFYGQGVKLGMVDSGALFSHSQLAGQLESVAISGKYGSTGNRYQQWDGLNDAGNAYGNPDNPFGHYEKGEEFNLPTSDWAMGLNDSHGTHVAGTIVGKRDGVESDTNFQGISFGSTLVVGNTGGTDNSTYGPILTVRDGTNVYSVLDYNFFYAVYDAVAGAGAKFINNSWGTNTRVDVYDGKDVDYWDKYGYSNFDVSSDWIEKDTFNVAERDEKGDVKLGADGKVIYTEKEVTLDVPAGYVAEWWLYEKAAAEQEGKQGFIEAAADVAKKHDIVQVFTTGNRNEDNPYYRAAYPHFNPDAEKHWVAVAGAKLENGKLVYKSSWNDAGHAKWWTVAAPGDTIYSSKVNADGSETSGNSSGTSMSAPHVTGALGVLASRYAYMTPTQVRDVMFTTANQDIEFETTDDGKHDAEESLGNGVNQGSFQAGVPDVNFGWGVPDLDKGMYGPGQLLGRTEIDLGTYSDVWSNDISQTAWNARKVEDQAELKKVTEELAKLTNPTTEKDKAMAEYYQIRKDELTARLDKDGAWYNGKLVVKATDGVNSTLILTGDNTFEGGVYARKGATVLGFNESFGDYKKKGNGHFVIEDGARGGILASYTDNVTDKGLMKDRVTDKSTTVTVKEGGTLVIANGSTSVKSLKVTGDAFVTGFADGASLAGIYENGKKLTGTLTVVETAEGLDKLTEAQDDGLLFFNSTTTVGQDGKSVSTEIVRDESKTFGMFAQNANQSSVAAGIEAQKGKLFEALLMGDEAMFNSTLDTLDNDLLLNAQNAAIVNTMDVTKAVKDQALRRGEGNFVELAHGAHLWATGVGSWGSAENTSDVDVDFYAGLFGLDYQFGNTTLGAFFGAGTTDFKGGVDGKLDSDDIHLGLYGKTDIGEMVSVSYGLTHTMQDREGNRTVNLANNIGYSAFSTDADITQFYVEGAYTGIKLENGTTVEPYAGFSYIRASADGVSDTAGGMTYTTDIEDQNVQATTLGVRGQIPFAVGAAQVALKGDVAWSHFFGDTAAEGRLGGVAGGVIEGAELSDMFSIGLGVEAAVGKNTTFGLSYTGNFDSDVKSNGISANIRYAF